MHQGLFKREKWVFARTTLCTQIPMNNNVIRLVIDRMRDLFLHIPYVQNGRHNYFEMTKVD